MLLRDSIIGLALLALSAGCAYHGPQTGQVASVGGGIDNPVVRKVAWFSYLDGNDIRETCGPGTIDRFRLVYNAQYEKQLRSYEVTGDGTGGAHLVARARPGTANLAELTLHDPMAPWRWKKSETRLTPQEFDEFRRLLNESGFGGPPPDGKRLHSRDFYWVASGCQSEKFHFDAWVDAQGDFSEIKFQAFLIEKDKTGLAFRQAVPVPGIQKIWTGRREGQNPPQFFVLTVSDSGIGGLLNAF